MSNSEVVPTWSTADLDAGIERRDEFFVLDVRNRNEFEAARIESRLPLGAKNIPYFEMLESASSGDFVAAIADYASTALRGALPQDRLILVVCAKGDTSALVAQALHRLGYRVANLAGGMREWFEYHSVRQAAVANELMITQIARPARGCLSYVVASGRRAIIVDPLRHADHYLSLCRREAWEIELVIDTHGHADHISGGPALAAKLGVPYCLHPYDGIHPIDMVPARNPFSYLRDGWAHTFGSAMVRAIHIPGHTLGNTALLVNNRYLLSGDSIFIHSLARPDLGGRGDAWAPLHYRSLARLLEFPDTTVVFPGHFSSRSEANEHGVFAAPLGELRERNEGLRILRRGEAEFVRYMLSSLPTFPPEYLEIKRVNAGLSTPDDERATELETGKNICALSPSAGARS